MVKVQTIPNIWNRNAISFVKISENILHFLPKIRYHLKVRPLQVMMAWHERLQLRIGQSSKSAVYPAEVANTIAIKEFFA